MEHDLSLEHVLSIASIDEEEHPKVTKAGERDFIPELTPEEQKAALSGLLGISLDEPLPPDLSAYEQMYYRDSEAQVYDPGTIKEDRYTIENGNGINR